MCINNNCGGCNQCQPTICNTCPPTECECPVKISTDCSTFTGDTLACSGVEKDTILTDVIIQLDAYICEAIAAINASINLINIGTGAEIYKGIDGIGRREIRKINAVGDLITVIQNTNDISISIDEENLIDFIEDNAPPIDNSFLRTIDSSPLDSTLKIISDNANNPSVLELSTKDVTNKGAGNSSKSTAFGEEALTANTTGEDNSSFGYRALKTNTTGIQNTAIGSEALRDNTTGSANTAEGSESLKNNTTGSRNTAVGHQGLLTNTNGNKNTAIGYQALLDTNLADNNTAIGDSALGDNMTGNSNTGVGVNSLEDNTSGSSNTAIGMETKSGNFNQSVVIGRAAAATGDNQFVVGSPMYNAGVINNEEVTSTKTWNVVINGVMLKILLANTDDIIVEQGNFGYNVSNSGSACADSCTATNLVAIYRDNVFGLFEFATQLATDISLTTPAPAGYYAEFSNSFSDSIVRYWDGINFTGAPGICGCT